MGILDLKVEETELLNALESLSFQIRNGSVPLDSLLAEVPILFSLLNSKFGAKATEIISLILKDVQFNMIHENYKHEIVAGLKSSEKYSKLCCMEALKRCLINLDSFSPVVIEFYLFILFDNLFDKDLAVYGEVSNLLKSLITNQEIKSALYKHILWTIGNIPENCLRICEFLINVADKDVDFAISCRVCDLIEFLIKSDDPLICYNGLELCQKVNNNLIISCLSY